MSSYLSNLVDTSVEQRTLANMDSELEQRASLATDRLAAQAHRLRGFSPLPRVPTHTTGEAFTSSVVLERDLRDSRDQASTGW